MKIKALKICYKDRFFKLDVFLGNMLEFFFLKNTNNDEIDSKINDYCNYVDNPYVLKSNLPSISKRKIDNPDRSFPRILAWIYIKLCNSSFLFVRILSFLYFPIFNNTEEALCYFRSVFPEVPAQTTMLLQEVHLPVPDNSRWYYHISVCRAGMQYHEQVLRFQESPAAPDPIAHSFRSFLQTHILS